ncbi:diaminobutyrate--2-oxoglutarate transaminase [Rhodopseudomonas telluris]|uniref:Diaminobutyrate--2-oxoglutarate transaminase n=1 Tax=Rhodopseudomonas telluris TaxID=644215 RepID=A0ABV6EWX3_9BRAD
MESDVRWYSRRFPTIFVSGSGALLTDIAGRSYIDFFSGAGALNYGHNPPALKKALIDYIERDGIAHSLDMRTSARQEFISAFTNKILRPRNMRFRCVFTGPTGTDAIETALKLARKVTGRSNVAAFTNAYHGTSLGSLAGTASLDKRRSAGISLENVDRYPYDGYLGAEQNTIPLIAKLLSDPGSGFVPPAAFIVETVQSEGGLSVAKQAWLHDLADLARKVGSLLIIDDIQAGCGRTGKFFSFESQGIEPDIICLSKSISGFGLPMSLVLIRPEIDIWEPGEISGTFRGNNHAFVTATAATDYWTDRDFLDRVERNIEIIDDWLENVAESLPQAMFTKKGVGLIRGLHTGVSDLPKTICDYAFQAGLLVETSGAASCAIKLLPPLCMDSAQLSDGLMILSEVVRRSLS